MNYGFSWVSVFVISLVDIVKLKWMKCWLLIGLKLMFGVVVMLVFLSMWW